MTGSRSSSPAETLSFATVDGVDLVGDLWSSHPEATRATVVLVHGFTAHRRHPQVLATVRALTATGLNVLCYDGRGHGQSAGQCTLGDAEAADVGAAVELARRRSPERSVVLVGASMGAVAVLRYAADRDDVDGVVSVSGPALWRLRSVTSALAALLTQTRPGRMVLARRMNVRLAPGWTRPAPPQALVARVRCPLAVVHGLADRFISPREARWLHAAAAGPRRLDLVPRMGHALDDLAPPAVVAAVDWCLAPAAGDETGRQVAAAGRGPVE